MILVASLCVQAIDLIKEENRGAISLCMLEYLAEPPLSLANEFVYNHGPANVVEGSVELSGKTSGKKRFPCAGGSAEEYALDGIDSYFPQRVVGRKGHGREIESAADEQCATAEIFKRRGVIVLADNKGLRVEVIVAEKTELVNGIVCNHGEWLAVWSESDRLSLLEGIVGSL